MPVNFFSDAERERWQGFPGVVPQDDLHAFFLLTDDDKREVRAPASPPQSPWLRLAAVQPPISWDLCLTISRPFPAGWSRSWPNNSRSTQAVWFPTPSGAERKRIMSATCRLTCASPCHPHRSPRLCRPGCSSAPSNMTSPPCCCSWRAKNSTAKR